MRKTVVLSDGRRVRNLCRNPFFCDWGKCFVSFCRHHFLQFVYDLTVSQAWLRHHSTQHLMRNVVMLLDLRRVRNLCRNPFFCDWGKCLVLFCRHHFLQFVCDLTVSQAWLRHQSTQNSMRKKVVPLEGRRVRNSCRKPFFGEDGKCFVSFCCLLFLQFVYDLTVSRACLRHHSTQNLMRNAVMGLDRRRVWNSCRNRFFGDWGKWFVFFSVVVTFYNSYAFSSILLHVWCINQCRTE